MHIRSLAAALFCIATMAADLPTIAIMGMGKKAKGNSFNTAAEVESKVAQAITAAIVQSGRFQVVERDELSKVLGEGRFTNTGLVEDSQATRLGRQSGAQFILLGETTIAATSETKEPPKASWWRGDDNGPRYRPEEYWRTVLSVQVRIVRAETGVICDVIRVKSDKSAKTTGVAFATATEDILEQLGKAFTGPLNCLKPTGN